jgi:3-oxoacyl-[acyl-carrier protein] reductase
MNAFDFSGKTALVVGGSSGIGNAIAQRFRKHGAQVHVWGTRENAADYRAEDGSDLEGLHYRRMDATDVESVQAFMPAFEQLDILVLSQGAALYARKEYEIGGFARSVDLNLNSVMNCCTRFFPMLRDSKGTIITVSSIGAFLALVGNPGYAAAKAGAESLTRTLGFAWAREGIRVNGIAPGLVGTKLTKVTTEHPKRMERALEKIAVGRLGTPEDMADVALFLASPLAAYVTGHTIPVDGGMRLSR